MNTPLPSGRVPADAKARHPLDKAWLFGLIVLFFLPALLFSYLLPPWISQVALAGLFVVFGLRYLATSQLVGQPYLDGATLGLALMLAVGLGTTGKLATTLPLTCAFVANLALFWVAAAQQDQPWLRQTGWLLLAAGLLLGVIVFEGANLGSNKLPFIDRGIYATLPERRPAFWDAQSFNPNISAGLLAMFWPPLVILAWRGQSWPQRDMAKVAALALAVLLLLTQSRGALLAALAGLLVITILQNRRWLFFWLALTILPVAAGFKFGAAALGQFFLGQSSLFTLESLAARQEIWQRAIYLIRDHPLSGVGLGMVGPTIQQFYPLKTGTFVDHAHNIYLQVGAELGLPGLAAHLVLYATIFVLLLRRALSPPAGHYQVLALGLLGSLVVFLTHGLFDAVIASPQVALIVWGLLGLMVAVAMAPINAERQREQVDG
jgi:putative inorganic carbon (HCO3(-)) transporter